MICKGCEKSYPDAYDCGGDCIFCMAEYGDPDCIPSAMKIARETHAKLQATNEIVVELANQRDTLAEDVRILADSTRRQGDVIRTLSRCNTQYKAGIKK